MALTVYDEGVCSGSGLENVGQTSNGVMFTKANGEFSKTEIQVDNVAFSSLMANGSFMLYGVYVSGVDNLIESYKDVVTAFDPA